MTYALKAPTVSNLDEIVLLFGGITLLFLIVAKFTGSNTAMICVEVLAMWCTAIASQFVLTNYDRIMPTVLTPQGWEDLGMIVSFLVCGNGRHSTFYSKLPNCVSGSVAGTGALDQKW